MATPVKVWLMENEIGYVSRDLANQLYRNLSANLVKTSEPVLDKKGEPVYLEGSRDSWEVGLKGKLEKTRVPTLQHVMIERTEGIKLSPFVAGSVRKRRSVMIEDRNNQPLPFADLEADTLPTIQFTQTVHTVMGFDDMNLGARISDIAESIVVADARYKKELEMALGLTDREVRGVYTEGADLIVRGEYVAPEGDASITLTGMNLDEVYANCTAQEKQFLHDTLLSGTDEWGDNRSDEEKKAGRLREDRYNEDVRALKAKWGSGLYHGS